MNPGKAKQGRPSALFELHQGGCILSVMTPEDRFQALLDAGDKIEPRDWMPDEYRATMIRHEAMRDGIVDHELLSKLAERDPAAAKDLVSRHILDFDEYDTDIATFRKTRRELLKRLSGA